MVASHIFDLSHTHVGLATIQRPGVRAAITVCANATPSDGDLQTMPASSQGKACMHVSMFSHGSSRPTVGGKRGNEQTTRTDQKHPITRKRCARKRRPLIGSREAARRRNGSGSGSGWAGRSLCLGSFSHGCRCRWRSISTTSENPGSTASRSASALPAFFVPDRRALHHVQGQLDRQW
jgi:hypothetical protein